MTTETKDCYFTFSIPGQFGGPESSDFLMEYAVRIREVLSNNMKGRYFKNINEFCIILRVSGSLVDFKGDGPECLRYMKKQRYIKIDLVIPGNKWNNISPQKIKENFCNGIRNCFYLMLERAKKDNDVVDEQGIIGDFEKSMYIFQKEPYPETLSSDVFFRNLVNSVINPKTDIEN